MQKPGLLFLSVIILCYCSDKYKAKEKPYLKTKVSNNQIVIKSLINEGLPLFIFKLNGKKNGNTFNTNSIIIHRKNKNKPIQRIDIKFSEMFFSKNHTGFYVEDVNFDEFADIRLVQFIPASPNVPYFYWLYNPKTKKFEYAQNFEKIYSPQVKQKEKIIVSHWRALAVSHGIDYFKIINNKPVLVKRISRKKFPDKPGYLITVKKRVNGKLKITEQRTAH